MPPRVLFDFRLMLALRCRCHHMRAMLLRRMPRRYRRVMLRALCCRVRQKAHAAYTYEQTRHTLDVYAAMMPF